MLKPVLDKQGNKILKKLSRGNQILYVPTHLMEGVNPGDEYHLRVINRNLWGYPNGIQPGFVTSGPNNEGDYFCRFWKFDENGLLIPELRTKFNSEATPPYAIVLYSYFNVGTIQDTLTAIDSKRGYE